MSPFIRFLSLAWLLPAMAGTLVAVAGAQQIPAPVLSLRPAAEISLPTEAGRVYQWQSSPDLQSWKNLGDPVFGTGASISQPVSGSSVQFLRLQIVDAPPVGDAPWSLEGSATQLNEGARTLRYQFNANGQGVSGSGSAAKSFSWAWLRDGMACGRAELTFGDGTREVIQLRYCAPKVGQFTRQTFTGTRLDNTDAGTFGPAPATAGSLVPASIQDRPLALSGPTAGCGLSLAGLSGGVRLLDGCAMAFTGNWLVTGSTTARLTAHFSPTHGEDYRFTFTGPLTGHFTRQTFTEGVYRDEDQGTFCLNPAP